MKKLFFLLLAMTSLHAGGISFYNNSNYTLTVDIHNIAGVTLGSMTVVPDQQMKWQDSLLGSSVLTQHPYTLLIYCPNGDKYGIIDNVRPGMNVSARSAFGPQYCSKTETEMTPSDRALKKVIPPQGIVPGSTDQN